MGLTQFVLLESLHFSKRVAAYLRGKGTSAAVIHTLDDLRQIEGIDWNDAVIVADIDMAGTEGVRLLEDRATFVILTGRPSSERVVFETAERMGWEALIKPYTPEELHFRTARIRSERPYHETQPKPESEEALPEIVVEAFKGLFGCPCARLLELRQGESVILAEEMSHLSGELFHALGNEPELLQEIEEQGTPVILRASELEARTGTYLDPYTAGDVLAIPFGQEGRSSFLLLLSRGPGFTFDRRDKAKARALSTLGHRLFASPATDLSPDERLGEITAKVGEYLPSGIIVVDGEGNVFSINRYGASILQTQPDVLVRRSVAQAFGLKRSDKLYRALTQREPCSGVEQEVLLPDGTTALLGLSTAIIGAEGDSERGLVLIFQDISERKRLQERLRRTEQLASLGAMAAGMAHEIRNPLASMLTGVQILGSLPPGDPRAKRHRETIIQQITRLNQIIRDLLTLGRPAKPKRKPCAVDRPIRQAVDTITSRASERNVNIRIDIEQKIPAVYADEAQIQQVLINLFLNAVEAMPDGGELSIAVRERKGAVVRVDITDTGIGMSQDDIAHAFTPFFSTKAQGSGLGLSVCNRIIADHEGQLELKSKMGKGTTVLLELPLASAMGA